MLTCVCVYSTSFLIEGTCLLILSHFVLASRKDVQFTNSCVTFDKFASVHKLLLVYGEINQIQNRVRTVLTYSTAWKMAYQLQQDEWRLSLIPYGAPVSPPGATGLESSSMSAK